MKRRLPSKTQDFETPEASAPTQPDAATKRLLQRRLFWDHVLNGTKSKQYVFVGDFGVVTTKERPSTIITALSLQGVVAAKVIEGKAPSAALFEQILSEDILPTMNVFPQPHSVLLLNEDNLPRATIDRIFRQFEDAGALCIFLPPRSPDLNPVNHVFEAAFTEINNTYASQPTPVGKLALALHSDAATQAPLFFHQCGYQVSAAQVKACTKRAGKV